MGRSWAGPAAALGTGLLVAGGLAALIGTAGGAMHALFGGNAQPLVIIYLIQVFGQAKR